VVFDLHDVVLGDSALDYAADCVVEEEAGGALHLAASGDVVLWQAGDEAVREAFGW
jgi:hypothetical protein